MKEKNIATFFSATLTVIVLVMLTVFRKGSTHKRSVFLVVGPLRFDTSYTNDLVVYRFKEKSFVFA